MAAYGPAADAYPTTRTELQSGLASLWLSNLRRRFFRLRLRARGPRVGIGTGGRRAGPERVPIRGPALEALMRRATSAHAAFGNRLGS